MEEKKKPSIEELLFIISKLGIENTSEDKISIFKSEEDNSEYQVWLINNKYVLKRAKAFEIEMYQTFFNNEQTYVPKFLGSYKYKEDDYFLTEYFNGKDLRYADKNRLTKALDALIDMQEEYWGRVDLYDRCVNFDKALKGIDNRSHYLNSSLLEEVYQDFIKIYKNTPRTLCHEDLLPINILANEDKAVMIDWEYGGMLPYLSSFSRLIAHVKNDKNYYFYMSDEDKKFAIDYYYTNLVQKHNISRSDYLKSLDYFLFYEYTEWIMMGNRYDAKDDYRFDYYMKLATELATKLKK